MHGLRKSRPNGKREKGSFVGVNAGGKNQEESCPVNENMGYGRVSRIKSVLSSEQCHKFLPVVQHSSLWTHSRKDALRLCNILLPFGKPYLQVWLLPQGVHLRITMPVQFLIH
jgi:hypothetical protein